ncbi:hypothetical protein RvY_04552 [Ramazzottius varieornatus]|uniref:Uncharacterized protein n=1 Tax=Ramazzottius varieornatus TaxID=947166 RepID=A0A1D1URZ3_RAMVA|nr:hypothetical protein RvY_04552 [Ramazzottius varieornatus]
MHTRKKKNLTTTSGVWSVPTISPSEYGLQSPFFPSSTSPDIVSSRYHGLGSVMHPALGKFNE